MNGCNLWLSISKTNGRLPSCARQYGISRKTSYKWMTRYEAEGWPGIREHSRAPHMCPHETPEALQERLVQLRRQWPHWGPRKLLHRLAILEPETAWPAPSTAGDILKRHGLVATRRRRCRTPSAPSPLQAARAAQRGVGHGLQRVVPDAGWQPHRPLDALGPRQPVFVVL